MKLLGFKQSVEELYQQGPKITWAVHESSDVAKDKPVVMQPAAGVDDIINERRLYSIKELLAKNGGPLPVGLSTLYAVIKRKQIKSTHIGGRVFIPGWAVKELFARSK